MRRGLSPRMRWLIWAYATGWPRIPRSLDARWKGDGYPEGRCRLRVEPHPAHDWQATGLLTVDPPWFHCPGISSPVTN